MIGKHPDPLILKPFFFSGPPSLLRFRSSTSRFSDSGCVHAESAFFLVCFLAFACPWLQFSLWIRQKKDQWF